MERWALVSAGRAEPTLPDRRRALVPLGVLAVLVSLLLVGGLLARDPVGYHVVVWPFANGLDRDEAGQVRAVAAAARAAVGTAAGLAGVPAAVRRIGVEVLAADVQRPDDLDGSVLLRLRLHLRDGSGRIAVRCRDVLVDGRFRPTVVSRRGVCPPPAAPTPSPPCCPPRSPG